MRKHMCLLDHHQRSHYDTITIGPEGKFNWVLQLINSQKVRLFDSHEAKFNTPTFSQLTQPIPKPICDRSGQLEDTQGVFVVKGETSRSHEIVEKDFHEKLCASDGSGQPDECNSSSAHTVKEQHAPDEHREIASFNTNNEFNRAINEEDIDFNIPGVPHSTVKQLHGASVRDLIQNIENHPHRRALQSDLQQHRQFNPFSKESRDVIKSAGNTELCELLDVEPKAQCKVCLSDWDVRHRLLHVRTLLARWNEREQEIRQVHS